MKPGPEFAFKVAPDGHPPFRHEAYRVAEHRICVRLDEEFELVILASEAGCGKTTLLMELAAQIGARLPVVYLHRPPASYPELLRSCYRNVEIAGSVTAAGNRLVVLIDDADKIDLDILAAARAASAEGVDFRFVLACLPDCAKQLQHLADAREMAVATCRLGQMEHHEVQGFIEHRLAVSGATGTFFGHEALERIALYANGTARLVNSLCGKALVIAAMNGASEASVGAIDEAAMMLGLEPPHAAELPEIGAGEPLLVATSPLLPASSPAAPSLAVPSLAASSPADSSLSASPLVASAQPEDDAIRVPAPLVRTAPRRRRHFPIGFAWFRHRAAPIGAPLAALALLLAGASMIQQSDGPAATDAAAFGPAPMVAAVTLEPGAVTAPALATVPILEELQSPDSPGGVSNPDGTALPPLDRNGIDRPAAESGQAVDPRVPARYVDNLLSRGRRLWAKGEHRAARMFLGLAAADGNARAARELARTYDPRYVRPDAGDADRDLAIRWYGEAAKAGDSEAETRMQELLGRAERQAAAN